MTAAASSAAADAISLKLLSRYSYATFKTDAPLETVVGHTADAGLWVSSPSIPPGRRPRAAR